MYCSSNEQGYYLIASRTFVNTTIYMYIQCKRLQCTGSERQTFTVYWIRITNVHLIAVQKGRKYNDLIKKNSNLADYIYLLLFSSSAGKVIQISAIYCNMKCSGKHDTTWNIPRTTYHVFPATFHVISWKINFLWDSE